MKKIAILGFGKEGQATLSFLLTNKRFTGAQITILTKTTDPLAESAAETYQSVTYEFGAEYLSKLTDFDIVIRSPGIPYFTPEIQIAVQAGVEVTSGTKLFFEALRNYVLGTTNYVPKTIGITGTKGKGTVATLLDQMLRSAGHKTVLVGNIGEPALGKLQEAKEADFAVCELSSFQLQDMTTSPDIAVILDITPDHLDAHKNMKEYIQAKSSITKFQSEADHLFYFPGKSTESLVTDSRAKKHPVDISAFSVFSPKLLQVPGAHTYANAVMAASVALTLGIPEKTVREAVGNFGGLPHRLELIRVWQPANTEPPVAIMVYNDSAATNPEATVAAVQSFSDPLILIAGGKDKDLDYSSLGKALKDSTAFSLILFGENKEKIKSVCASWAGTIHETKNLTEAVRLAVQAAAQKQQNSNYSETIIILFSPASASFDMFKNAYDRGDQFRRIVKS